ncbi:UNVERIFIED_ORG: D-alanyl-D-alanine carboxypeptidase (penicillin-binding protein 5/6) [Rhizobium esperanzae]
MIDVVRGFTSGGAPDACIARTSQQDAKTSSAKSARDHTLQAGADIAKKRRALRAHDQFSTCRQRPCQNRRRRGKSIQLWIGPLFCRLSFISSQTFSIGWRLAKGSPGRLETETVIPMTKMTSRLRATALWSALLISAFAQAEAGQASFVVDVRSGQVLEASNQDDLNYPASLTKMMTLYLAFEALHQGRLTWEQKLTMSENAESKEPFKLAIGAGRQVTLREAVESIVVLSANDSAVAIAEQLGGSEQAFARAMTDKAHQLGMKDTVFKNPSGLPDPEQVTTARDMATLGVSLMRDFPEEFKLFSMRGFQFRGMKLRGHNNLMYRYDGVDGIKTGYTDASGYNVVTSALKGGRRVVGVVMGEKTASIRDDKMAGLLDSTLSPSTATAYTTPGTQPGATMTDMQPTK